MARDSAVKLGGYECKLATSATVISLIVRAAHLIIVSPLILARLATTASLKYFEYSS